MSIEIFIKTINNESYRYDVDTTIAIRELKSRITETTSIPQDRQRLIYRGQVLQDEESIQSYNIENGHTIHMVARPANVAPSPVRSTNEAQESQQAIRGAIGAQRNDPLAVLLNPLGGLSELLFQGGNRSETPPQNRNNQSLEHIWQSLLTMHSLRSSMSSRAFIPEQFTHAAPLREEDELPERSFYVGQWIDVKDTVNQWLEATVMQRDNENKRIFVHYNGWPTHWDEWIAFDSPRISPFRTRTVHTGISGLQCPTPNTIASFAPSTGRDDIRRLLPAVLEMYDSIGVVLRRAVALSEESLFEDPFVHDYTPSVVLTSTGTNAIAPGMPWPDANVPIRRRSQDDGRGGRGELVSSTNELAELSQLLFPLLDRLGRVLTDTAAHLDLEPQTSSTSAPSAVPDRGSSVSAHADVEREAASLESTARRYLESNSLSRSNSSTTAPATASSAPSINDSQRQSNGLAALLQSNLPPSLRQLLQPRPPSPPPQRAYRQLINSAPSRGFGGGFGGVGINHLVDIHIHAILTPSRPSGAAATSGPDPAPTSRTPLTEASERMYGFSSGRGAPNIDRPTENESSHLLQNYLRSALSNSSGDGGNDQVDHDNPSSDNDSDDIAESLENEESDVLSGAVGAVSSILASSNESPDRINRNASRESIDNKIEDIEERSTFPKVNESDGHERIGYEINTASNSNEKFDMSTSDSAAGASPSTHPPSPKSAVSSHRSNVIPSRRKENNNKVAESDGIDGKYRNGGLSDRERSTAQDLIQKYRSREKEQRKSRDLTTLLSQASMQGSQSAAHIDGSTSGPSDRSDEPNIVPTKIKPLKIPLEGLYSDSHAPPPLQFSESSVSTALEYEDRIAMENSVLRVQRKMRDFDRRKHCPMASGSDSSPSPTAKKGSCFGSPARRDERFSPGESERRTVEKVARPIDKQKAPAEKVLSAAYSAGAMSESRTSRGGVDRISDRTSNLKSAATVSTDKTSPSTLHANQSNINPTADDSGPGSAPKVSLLSRFKRAVSLTDRLSTTDGARRKEK